ncbi:MAG TPA: LptF/LptG family permease, partial [Gemmatimonadaceae bacterium]|nr:LptF/LptG family permease [Gemmatimonadaceae bacterium]
NADTTSKGEREMSICEMQHELDAAVASLYRARVDSLRADYRAKTERGLKVGPPPPPDTKPKAAGGIGALYCRMLTNLFHVPAADAAEVPHFAQQQDTSKKKAAQQPAAKVPAVPPQKPGSIFVIINGAYQKVPMNNVPANAYIPGSGPAKPQAPAPTPQTPAPNAAAQAPITPTPAAVGPPPASATLAPSAGISPQSEITDAKFRIDEARHRRNRYDVEIQKKFSLAAACIVFVLVGAPIALRFPRGGVGVVIGVSFFVFAVYYVGLIGGESLANKSIITPFWAMWADNIIFLIVGIILMTRMGREGVTGRGGTFAELLENLRDWRQRRRAATEARA